MPGQQQPGVGVVTEILDQRQPRRFIYFQQGRRGQAQPLQLPGDAHKRADGFALGRRIHQQQAGAVQAEIAPGRSIRRQGHQRGPGETGACQEGGALVFTGWQ
ncbi:hypothetical protein D3C75_1215970 [compost metagenome]